MVQSRLIFFIKAQSAELGLMQTDEGKVKGVQPFQRRFRLKWKLALAGIVLPQISKLSTREA
jgi:hypothetical protein